MNVTIEDLKCMISVCRFLEQEGFNKDTLSPKQKLCAKMAMDLTDEEFNQILTPKWLKQLRNQYKLTFLHRSKRKDVTVG